MDYGQAIDLFSQIMMDHPGEGDLHQLQDDFIAAAVRYARKRVDWQIAETGERLEMERSRKTAHDAFIDTCNVLDRCMKKKGLPTDWRSTLGDDRRELGDFACFVHLILGLRAR